MQLSVITKDIRVVPEAFKDIEKPFTIVFRYPTQVDIAELEKDLLGGRLFPVANHLFKGFENKIELVDEDGKVLDYDTFNGLMSFGGSDLTKILHDVATQLADAVRNGAGKLEKKS